MRGRFKEVADRLQSVCGARQRIATEGKDSVLEREVAEAFCEECRSAYENWVTCRIVFDDLPARTQLTDAEALDTPIGQCIDRVFRMCLEAWTMQVVRLDDPARQGDHRNLSVHRIQEAKEWTADERSRLDEIVARLCPLPARLRAARNKFLSHNDLDARLANAALGGFCLGDDTAYFHALAEIATMVWEKWCRFGAHPSLQNQVFDFNLDALADDVHSAGFQAQQLRNCLCQGLREQAALQL